MEIIVNEKGIVVEWSPADRRQGLPRRFQAALECAGATAEKTIASLLTEWVAQIEVEAAKAMLERAPTPNGSTRTTTRKRRR